jgi:hypothetical protein
MTNKNTIGSFTTQGPASFISTSQVSLGDVTNVGAWTLGPSGFNGIHTINANQVTLSAPATGGAHNYNANGQSWQYGNIGSSAGAPGGTNSMYWYDATGTKFVGGISTAGAWTFGTVGGVQVQQMHGALQFSTGSSTPVPTYGLRRNGSNALEFFTNGGSAGFIDSSNNWVLGQTNFNGLHTINSGANFIFANNAQSSPTTIAGYNNGIIQFTGNTGNTDRTGIFGTVSGLPVGIGFERVNSGNWQTDIVFKAHPAATSNLTTLTEVGRVSGEGRWTFPQQPYAFWRNTNGTVGGNGGYVCLSGVLVESRGSFTFGNGVFTAPVSGVYQVCASAEIIFSSSQTSNDCQLYINTDGSDSVLGTFRRVSQNTQYSGSAIPNQFVNIASSIYLNAGQTCVVWAGQVNGTAANFTVRTTASQFGNINPSWVSIALIG